MSEPHTHPVADASVRTATVADAEAVGAVQAAVFRETYAAWLDPSLVQAEPLAEAWRQSLSTPPSSAYRLLVAAAAERVVGFAAVGPSGDPDATDVDAELLVGGVDPADRRGGHGSRLLNAAVDTASAAGFVRVRCWVLADGAATQEFLRGAGFVLDGARRERVVGVAEDERAAEVRLTADIPA